MAENEKNRERVNDDATPARVADKLCNAVRAVVRAAKTEEDLKIAVEKHLAALLGELGVTGEPTYETFGGGAASVFKGRPDAVHGQVIIEYKAPGALDQGRNVAVAYGELVKYITAQAMPYKPSPAGLAARLVGVGFDGENIFFVQYVPPGAARAGAIIPAGFTRRGPYVFNTESARTFLTHLRGLTRLPLAPEYLAERFGPKSALAPKAVNGFVDAYLNWASPRVRIFFEEWKRLFGIVYGEKFKEKQTEAAQELARLYGIPGDADLQLQLFAVHTYYALLIKLIAAEIITLNENDFASSFNHRLTHAAPDDFRAQLKEIEDGGVYALRGVTNFLEGDFFRWYLDAFSPRLEEAVREVARGLSEFEPATSHIAPAASRDLLKKLYQYLVPPGLRRLLGEFYTPDWLAEFLIKEVGYSGDPRKRFLDPACGSGTFLVLAIEKVRAFAAARNQRSVETAKNILENVWGFDLNPLAVIAARTNYLFALGNLTRDLHAFEIPVYLADSVLWPERAYQGRLNFSGHESMEVKTSVGVFHVPYNWIRGDRGFLFGVAAPVVEGMVSRLDYTVAETVKRLTDAGACAGTQIAAVETFIRELRELEDRGENGIWARFLKNLFAPVVAAKFDFVVGNPPWVRWGYLSEEYRAATLPMWKRYGLFPKTGDFISRRLGGGEKDFSMLFTYASADYYLRDGGKLAFLITQEVFKAKGAGEGFRRFRLGDEQPLGVSKAHDFVTVKPFEGAANKTAALVLKKGEATDYPVPYTVWNRKKSVGSVPTDLRWEDARKLLQRETLDATPITPPVGSWQTIGASGEKTRAVKGNNAYEAHQGVDPQPYGVFLLTVNEVLSDNDLLIENLFKSGKRKVPEIKERVESKLVYPAVRGKDISRWSAKPKIYILFTHDGKTHSPYPVSVLKAKWPRTFGYLALFKQILLTRASKPIRELAERTAFYTMYGVGPYSMARYKVVWQFMANDIIATVISQHKTPFGFKMVIPTKTTALIGVNGEAEAHYLCSLLNSTAVRTFVKSYSSAGRGFGAPSIMKNVGIPRFEPKNKTHAALAALSQRLHELAAAAEPPKKEIAKLEADVDKKAAALFGIK